MNIDSAIQVYLEHCVSDLEGIKLEDVITFIEKYGTMYVNSETKRIHSSFIIPCNELTDENKQLLSLFIKDKKLMTTKDGKYHILGEALIDFVFSSTNIDALQTQLKIMSVINIIPQPFFIQFSKYIFGSQFKEKGSYEPQQKLLNVEYNLHLLLQKFSDVKNPEGLFKFTYKLLFEIIDNELQQRRDCYHLNRLFSTIYNCDVAFDYVDTDEEDVIKFLGITDEELAYIDKFTQKEFNQMYNNYKPSNIDMFVPTLCYFHKDMYQIYGDDILKMFPRLEEVIYGFHNTEYKQLVTLEDVCKFVMFDNKTIEHQIVIKSENINLYEGASSITNLIEEFIKTLSNPKDGISAYILTSEFINKGIDSEDLYDNIIANSYFPWNINKGRPREYCSQKIFDAIREDNTEDIETYKEKYKLSDDDIKKLRDVNIKYVDIPEYEDACSLMKYHMFSISNRKFRQLLEPIYDENTLNILA